MGYKPEGYEYEEGKYAMWSFDRKNTKPRNVAWGEMMEVELQEDGKYKCRILEDYYAYELDPDEIEAFAEKDDLEFLTEEEFDEELDRLNDDSEGYCIK